jgi:hypothetical protein
MPTGHRPRTVPTVGMGRAQRVLFVLRRVGMSRRAQSTLHRSHNPRGERIAPNARHPLRDPPGLSVAGAGWLGEQLSASGSPNTAAGSGRSPAGRSLPGCRVAAGCPHRWRPRRGGAHRRAGHKSASGPRADTVGTDRPEATSTTLGRRLRGATDDHQRDSPTGPALSLRGNSPQERDHRGCLLPPTRGSLLGTAHLRVYWAGLIAGRVRRLRRPSSRGR